MDNPLERFSVALTQLRRSRWFDPMTGGFPAVPVRDALPAATADLGYRLIAIRGTPDVVYVCLRDGSGDWDWRVAATG
jgi:hypothetical protein